MESSVGIMSTSLTCDTTTQMSRRWSTQPEAWSSLPITLSHLPVTRFGSKHLPRDSKGSPVESLKSRLMSKDLLLPTSSMLPALLSTAFTYNGKDLPSSTIKLITTSCTTGRRRVGALRRSCWVHHEIVLTTRSWSRTWLPIPFTKSKYREPLDPSSNIQRSIEESLVNHGKLSSRVSVRVSYFFLFDQTFSPSSSSWIKQIHVFRDDILCLTLSSCLTGLTCIFSCIEWNCFIVILLRFP